MTDLGRQQSLYVWFCNVEPEPDIDNVRSIKQLFKLLIHSYRFVLIICIFLIQKILIFIVKPKILVKVLCQYIEFILSHTKTMF